MSKISQRLPSIVRAIVVEPGNKEDKSGESSPVTFMGSDLIENIFSCIKQTDLGRDP
jgi:hypothetical protein